MANIYEEVRDQSVRQIILTPSGIAIALAIAFLAPSTYPVRGVVLAVIGLLGLFIGISAPRRWLTRKLGLRKKAEP
jgi:hypothetical protein